MAAVIEESILEVAPQGPGEIPRHRDALADALYGNAGQPFGHAAAASASTTGDAIKSAMPELVKGAGFARKGGNAPLHDHRDIALRAHQATLDLRNEVWRGYNSKADVVKSGFRGGFLDQFGALRTALMTPSIGEQLAQIVTAIGNPDLTRSFTAGNLGIGSVYGFVPFDLDGVLAS